MKFVTKSLIFLSLTALIGGSIAAYTLSNKSSSISKETTITNSDQKYTMENGDYTFELNEKDLKFTITKGAVSWSSG